jgi:hypothetical protein
MSSMSRIRAVGWTLAATLVAGATLGGCSDIYYDRRETVSLAADDAIASNRITHMVDPWPAHSGNRDIAFNGERMQSAVERYRRHEVIQPRSPLTTSVTTEQAATTTEAITTSRAPASAPAAAVKGP